MTIGAMLMCLASDNLIIKLNEVNDNFIYIMHGSYT